MRELQEKLLSGHGFDGSIQPKRFKLPLPSAERLYSAQGDQSPDTGLEPKSTLVLAEIANALKLLFCHTRILLQQVKVSGEVCLNAARWLAFCLR